MEHRNNMRLVMGGEALTGVLTGIGQYTYHLAELIGRIGDYQDYKFLIHGQLRASAPTLASCRQRMDDQKSGEAGRGYIRTVDQLRSSAAKSQLLVKLYQRLVPLLEKRTLSQYGAKDIYHSPNYMLPKFPGSSVVTIHDLSTYRFPEHHPKARVGFVNNHIERALAGADHIIAVSNTVRDEIIERFHYPEERVTTTYEGANEAFRPLTKADFDNTGAALSLSFKGYFLFVSSIEPRKNLDRLLDAYLAYRAAEGDNALPLIVSGMPGWNSSRTHERLKQLEDQCIVRYLGYVAQNLLPTLIGGARALLYPSLYEGFGLPVIEAMSCGTAVMTSRHTSMSEIAGGSALLICPHDTDSMQSAMHSLATNELLLASLEEKGLSRSSAFSWERCASETVEVYRSLSST
jgi:alpha-1,3-rhamnosyl/mannosyltransferase